jgi:hypothetical protein
MRVFSTIVELVGFGLVTVGIWLIFPPVAFMFAGFAIVGVSFWKNR